MSLAVYLLIDREAVLAAVGAADFALLFFVVLGGNHRILRRVMTSSEV